MKLLLGLGNPTKQYQNTRHNIGQMVILSLVKDLHLDPENHPKLLSTLGKHNQTLIGHTTTFMNTSGMAVQKIVNFYKIDPADLYIIHDDLDIGVGEYKIQFGHGSAGHHGIESIVENLGTQDFNRIRIGIGHPRLAAAPSEGGPRHLIPVEDYVLQPFTSSEKVIIDQTIDKIIVDLKNILGR